MGPLSFLNNFLKLLFVSHGQVGQLLILLLLEIKQFLRIPLFL